MLLRLLVSSMSHSWHRCLPSGLGSAEALKMLWPCDLKNKKTSKNIIWLMKAWFLTIIWCYRTKNLCRKSDQKKVRGFFNYRINTWLSFFYWWVAKIFVKETTRFQCLHTLDFIQTLTDCASGVVVGVLGRMWVDKAQEESGITNLIKYRGILTTPTETCSVRKCVGSVFKHQN